MVLYHSTNPISSGDDPLLYYSPQRSCGKVIFSQVRECLADTPPDRTPPSGQTLPLADIPSQADIPRTDLHLADTPWTDTPRQTHPSPGRHPLSLCQTGTTVDATHPTGMHSCFTSEAVGTWRRTAREPEHETLHFIRHRITPEASSSTTTTTSSPQGTSKPRWGKIHITGMFDIQEKYKAHFR